MAIGPTSCPRGGCENAEGTIGRDEAVGIENMAHNTNVASVSVNSNAAPSVNQLNEVTAAEKKTVAFVSTKRVRHFDTDSTTNYPEEELEVDFGKISRLRARKAPKRVESERFISLSVTHLLSDSPMNIKSEFSAESIFADETAFLETTKKRHIKVGLLHSHIHTQLLHKAMQYIHRDRDLLLESLLKWSGFFHGASKCGPLSSFLSIVPPKLGTRELLSGFHDSDYLDLLQFPLQMDVRDNNEVQEKLTKYGLEDDCPLPTDAKAHALLWKYCLAVTGASCDAASLLVDQTTDVAVHWGGGRHHAHYKKAGGFCFVNDIVLAIHTLLQRNKLNKPIRAIRRVLYIDLDIHHPDGVQSAFYSTDEVLTASFHRHAAGFFPASSGSISEKGQPGTQGLGYNLNIPLPARVCDTTFLYMYKKLLFGLVNVYEPHVIVLCVGADGLKGDALVNGGISGFDHVFEEADDYSYYMRSESFDVSSSSGEGWLLSPECLAECVRIAAALCSGYDQESICTLPSAVTEKSSGFKNASRDIIEQEAIKQEDLPYESNGFTSAAPCQVSSTNHTNNICAKNPSFTAQEEETRNAMSVNVEASNKQKDASDHQGNCANNASFQSLTRPLSLKQCNGKNCKLLVLGGGGYSPSQVARTWVLCSAAACEGARPGMFWQDLPKDIPNHCYFPRYGPTFELVSDKKREEFARFYLSSSQEKIDEVNAGLPTADREMLHRGIKAIDLACFFIERQRKKASSNSAPTAAQPSTFSFEAVWAEEVTKKNKSSQSIKRGGRRKKLKIPSNDS